MTSPFTIRGLQGQQTSILGLWQPLAPAPVAFSPSAILERGAAIDEEEVVWSVLLPGNPTLAGATVQHHATSLQTVQRAMAQVTPTLRDLPTPWLAMPSFALPHAADSTSPEATLWRHLAPLQGGEEAVAFGLGLPSDWSQVVADFQAFVQQMSQLLKPSVRVETQVEGVLQVYTRVAHTGDFATFWSPHTTAQHAQLHHHILSLTLESRLTLVQLLAQATTGAALLAAKFSLPGGAVMALPATWRYVQDVIAGAEKLTNLQRDIVRAR